MANLVLSPDIREFADLMSTQNSEQFDIHEVAVNKTITLGELDCWNKTGATVLGIKTASGEYQLNPIAKTLLRPGHRLIVMGSKEQIDKAAQLLL